MIKLGKVSEETKGEKVVVFAEEDGSPIFPV